MLEEPIMTPGQACALFPRSSEEVHKIVDNAIRAARERLDALIAIPSSKRTYDNTVLAFDRAVGHFGEAAGTMEMISLVDPDKALREAEQAAYVDIKNAASIRIKECLSPFFKDPSVSFPITNPTKKPWHNSRYRNGLVN